MGRPLKIAKAQAVLTITDTNATTEEVTVSQTLSSLGVIAGMPFVVANSVGGLVAGITYWILTITGASTFTVSATPLNANPTYTPVNLSATTGQSVAASVGVVDSGFNNPAGISNTYGVVGGNTAIYGSQVLCRVAIGQTGVGTITVATDSPAVTGVGTDFANIFVDGSVIATSDGTVLGYIDDVANASATAATFAANATANVTAAAFSYATNEPGFIVRQKGKQKYLVQGTTSGNVAQCQTANVANSALAPNTMNIIATFVGNSTAFVQSLSDVNLEIFGNTAPLLQNAAPAYATFNAAEVANVDNGQPYPVVSINKA
jgi:hypothetical protein